MFADDDPTATASMAKTYRVLGKFSPFMSVIADEEKMACCCRMYGL
jgi:hypothetical protein